MSGSFAKSIACVRSCGLLECGIYSSRLFWLLKFPMDNLLVGFPLCVTCAFSLWASMLPLRHICLVLSLWDVVGFCFLILYVRCLCSSCICVGASFSGLGTFFLLSYWGLGIDHWPGTLFLTYIHSSKTWTFHGVAQFLCTPSPWIDLFTNPAYVV